MRITSGSVKGYKLKIPPGDRVKPAQSIVRQAIFNIIGEHIVNAQILDLFAGSGSYGLEALSRGAGWVDFVDKDKHCTQTIKENLLHTNFSDRAKVYTMKAKPFLHRRKQSEALQLIDFIFISPPYKEGVDLELLEQLPKVLKHGGLIIFEHSKDTKFPKPPKLPNTLKLLDQRTYGATTISFLQKTHKT